MLERFRLNGKALNGGKALSGGKVLNRGKVFRVQWRYKERQRPTKCIQRVLVTT